jgi:hypothetical protein
LNLPHGPCRRNGPSSGTNELTRKINNPEPVTGFESPSIGGHSQYCPLKSTPLLRTFPVLANRIAVKLVGRNQLIMALLNYLHGLVVQHQFKQRDYAVFGELRRDCPALHAWKLLFGVPNILRSLDHAYLVLPTFGLHGNDVMTTALVDADVEFIDFDLSYALYRRAQMVLQTVCGQSEEYACYI